MQEICSSNPPVVTGICDPNKSRAQHHLILKLDSELKYFNINHSNRLNILNKHTQHTLTHTVHIQIFLLKEPSFDGFLKKNLESISSIKLETLLTLDVNINALLKV